MSGNFLQGRYQPLNPSKYKGGLNRIVFRSSWELVAFKFCDQHPAILAWSSEETVIPYVSPMDNRVHRYFMDLKVWTRREGSDVPQVTLIEIKPSGQLKEPRKTATMKESTYAIACETWAVNQAKWQAARAYCEQQGWNFIFWTEKELDIEKDPDVKKRLAHRSKSRKVMKRQQAKRDQNVENWRAYFQKEMKKGE